MQFRPVLAPAAAALLLAGCGSSTSASKANFAKAINTALANGCITVNPQQGGTMTATNAFPLSAAFAQPSLMMSAAYAKAMNQRMFAPLHALVKAGILTEKDAQVRFENKMAPGRVYSLTSIGKQARQSQTGTLLCAGHYKVVEVVDYTVPSSGLGETISEVTYTYSPTGVPAWATSEAVKTAFPYFTKRLAPNQKGRATVVLKNNGWSADLGMANPYSTGY